MLLPALRRTALYAFVLLTSLAANACEDTTGPPVFDPGLGVDLAAMTKTSSGLYILELIVGTGATASPGTLASVRYTGWLPNGTQFDSGTFPLRLGGSGAIAGFDEGVRGMKVGGKRRIVMPPELGYGDDGRGSIPGKSYLVFQLDLLSVSP